MHTYRCTHRIKVLLPSLEEGHTCSRRQRQQGWAGGTGDTEQREQRWAAAFSNKKRLQDSNNTTLKATTEGVFSSSAPRLLSKGSQNPLLKDKQY